MIIKMAIEDSIRAHLEADHTVTYIENIGDKLNSTYIERKT